MKTVFLARMGCLLGLCVIGFTGRAHADEKPLPEEVRKPESTIRPPPAGLKGMVDAGKNDPDLAGLKVPEGVRVEIVAREPNVINPVAMRFEADGSLLWIRWVAGAGNGQETITYRDGTKRNMPRWMRATPDPLSILRDTNGDGRWDRSETLMDDLFMPPSLLRVDEWLYFTTRGSVIRRKRSMPQGPFDVQERLVQGLAAWHMHQTSGLSRSLDNWIYVTCGDEDSHAEGADGTRIDLFRNGGVWQMRPDGSRLGLFANGFRNPYRDVIFDDFGNMFHVDNDNEDGSKFMGCRLLHIQEEADYGWRLLDGVHCCSPDHHRGSVSGEKAGRMPCLVKTGRGGPAGLARYDSDRFPPFFQGLLLYPDVLQQNVRAYKVVRQGSTFAVVEQFTLLDGSSAGRFKPIQAVVGPDGAVYVADMRTGSWGDFVEGKEGRILRLSWSGTEEHPAMPLAPLDRWAKRAMGTDDELVASLEQPEHEWRLLALDALERRGDAARPRLIALALDGKAEPRARSAAMSGAGRLWNDAVEDAMVGLLGDGHLELRRLAAELLGRNAGGGRVRETSLAALTRVLTEDREPAVRRAAALSLGRLASLLPEEHADRRAAARSLWTNYRASDGSDQFLHDGMLRALERLGGAGLAPIGELARSTQSDDRAFAVGALEALRTRAGAELVAAALRDDDGWTPEQARRLLAAFRGFQLEPPLDPTPVGTWLEKHPRAPVEVQVEALVTLGLMATADSARVVPVVLRILQHPESSLRRAAIQAIKDQRILAAARPLAEALRSSGKDAAERLDIVAALAALQPGGRFAQFRSDPGVRGVVAELFELYPRETDAKVRNDLLGLLGQLDFKRAKPLAEEALASRDPATQSAALQVLSADPESVRQVAGQFLEGKLPEPLLPQVTAALERHLAGDKTGELAKLRERILADALVVKSEADLNRLAALVEAQGNADRGRAVFLDQRRSHCMKCHGLEGKGGKIGPDLSGLHKTMSAGKFLEAILEPSKEIKENFETYVVTTTDGKIYSGLKISDDGKRYVLRDAEGKDIPLAAEDVEEFSRSKTSLMPAGVTAALKLQELLDLVAFLRDGAAQARLR